MDNVLSLEQGMELFTRNGICADFYLRHHWPRFVKTREEIETGCTDVHELVALLGALGYVPCFRAQKYREEYAIGTAVVTVDETPFAVFVEIEAPPAAIGEVAVGLGRTPADYEIASYVTLWRRWCAAHDRPFGDMVFAPAVTPAP